MVKLFSEYKIKNMTLRNRIVMAPMCMYVTEDGLVNDWHMVHYTTRAVGGVGLIILEATGVESRGRISDRDLGLWRDDQVKGMAKLVASCKAQGACVGVQLAHAGRKSEVKMEQPVAPSAIAFSDHYRIPKELTVEEIKEIVKSFGQAARRAEEAGFDTIEIHAAHGYLISEFLSPLTNLRTDEYGGSIENRIRFLREILREIGKVWPKEKPILVRVSCEDYMEGGNHVETMVEILNALDGEGIDLVNVSSGGVVNVAPRDYPGYQVQWAETIRRETGLPVIAGGLISSPELAEEIIQNERADLIFLGRELLRNPYWAFNAAKKLRSDIEWPEPYFRGKR